MSYEDHDAYFASYSNHYIHETMLKDKIRTNSYKYAIEKNAGQLKDKVVLDVGCGTGILSIFAAKAGAKHVYAVDNADIVYYAQEIVAQNGLGSKITVIRGKIEEITLEVETVDVIISEWMGYFLLYESMMDTVLYARDKWLAKDGLILPDRAVLNICAIEDEMYKKNKLHFWDNVYGVKMSCMKKAAISEPLIDVCSKKQVNSTVCRIADFDLYTIKKDDLDFSSSYALKLLRDDMVHALVCWFDVFFDRLDYKVSFTTSPFNGPTHWKQTVFYLERDFEAYENDTIKGSIAVRKSLKNPRELDIKLSVHQYGKYGKGDLVQLFKVK